MSLNVRWDTKELNERFLTERGPEQWTFGVATQMMVQGVGPLLDEANLSTLIARMRVYFALNGDDGEYREYEKQARERIGMRTNIFPAMTDSQWERKQLRRWMTEYAERSQR